MFFEQSQIFSILNCDQCHNDFDHYDQPKSLPCGQTICYVCLDEIERIAVNKKFKCAICLKEHLIPEEGFAVNVKISKLMLTQAKEITRSDECEKLKEKSKNIQLKLNNLKFNLDNRNDKIETHCLELIAQIDELAEQKIEEINKIRESLSKKVNDYKQDCIQNIPKKEEDDELMLELNNFFTRKNDQIKKSEINNEEIKDLNEEADQLHRKLDIELLDIERMTFNNTLMKFDSNNNKIDSSFLGTINIQYFEPRARKLFFLTHSKIVLYDLKTNKFINKFDTSNDWLPDNFFSFKQAPGKRLITGSLNGTIKIWDTETFQCLKKISSDCVRHTDCVKQILILSNEKFVTCSEDKTIKLFDLNTFECIKTFNGHEMGVTSMDKISEDKFISGSKDKTIRVWDIKHDQAIVYSCNSHATQNSIQVRSFNSINPIFEYQNLRTVTCIIKLTNEEIASGHKNGQIKIWNIKNPLCTKTIDAHTNEFTYTYICMIKTFNDTIISCSEEDKKIKVWNTKSGNCLKTLTYVFGEYDSPISLDLCI